MRALKSPKLWTAFTTWTQQHHTATYGIAAGAVVAASALVGFVFFYNAPTGTTLPAKNSDKVADEPKPVYYSPLTGSVVPEQADTTRAVTAIMIENSPDARPQSGLKNSGIVYEAIAEGGITRFLALYQHEKPQLIGPVRSLRMYYVDWLAPYNASIAHIGGSKASLDEVRNGSYRDIDQFFNASTYWRANDRHAPHNVYTSFQNLDALNVSKGYTTSAFTGFARIDGKPSDAPNATGINVSISGPAYNSSYTYDSATNTYARSQGGAPHLDREDGQITPSTVIVLHTNMQRVLEDGYREQIVTTGTGKAHIFQNGTVTEAVWHKTDRASQLRFTDAAGAPISLVRGQTWITAVPNSTGKVTWQ